MLLIFEGIDELAEENYSLKQKINASENTEKFFLINRTK
jgi:hypothetical protein